MKKIVIAVCFFIAAQQGMAQHNRQQYNTYVDDNNGGNGFKKSNLFVGGSLNLGYSGYDFNVGGAPEIGYSINRFVDVGVLVNLNYTSERADPNLYWNNNERQRYFTYGAGTFGRFWPVHFLFLQVEPEYNWTKYSYKSFQTGDQYTENLNAASLLLGVGYGQRFVGRSSFYLAIMFDALSNYGSPYRDFNNAALPVIKAGFDIYLHPQKY
ncbi:MAG: hypothetical protein JST87_14545 [Bacteroidetes bacterium]|nr:hypothetical protein [Bacteroidota bacterium]